VSMSTARVSDKRWRVRCWLQEELASSDRISVEALVELGYPGPRLSTTSPQGMPHASIVSAELIDADIRKPESIESAFP